MGCVSKVQGQFSEQTRAARGLYAPVSRSTRWRRRDGGYLKMFSNLIESGSHAADLKRKGRFFLGTTLFYGLLLAFAGVGSIYAYNVKLDREADYELVALMRFPAAETRAERQQPRREQARSAADSNPGRASRVPTVTEVSMNTPYANRVASAETPVLRPGQA